MAIAGFYAATMDGTAVANSAALTGEISGNGFAPLRLIVETTEADAVTETALISIGFNSPDYNDMVLAHAVNPIAGVVEAITLPPRPMALSGSLHVRVFRAATGTALTFVANLEATAAVIP